MTKRRTSSVLRPRDEESRARTRFVATLKAPAHIHISGICGVGTASLAKLLHDLGFRVSGSDRTFYPPMGEVVRQAADEVFTSYGAENLRRRPDLVVIANNLRRDNPEVQAVLRDGIPYASLPEALEALLIGSREECPTSIVVGGTHGKTTTTAAIATLFDQAGWQPGYFIGGLPLDLPASIRAINLAIEREKRLVVLEGDEYDSAFFAKWPKFHCYRPDIIVLSSLEFDHADIYTCVEEIETEFWRLAELLPPQGVLLVCDESERLFALAQELAKIRDDVRCMLYGSDSRSVFSIVRRETVGRGQKLSFRLSSSLFEVETPLNGRHNALNLLAAAAVGMIKGLSIETLRMGLSAFHGVRRRQQIISCIDDIIVVEDFAHHPTAIALTLEGLRESYPEKRLIAVYEPRSNTSRRSFFQKEFAQSFTPADLVVLKEVSDAGNYSGTSQEIKALDVPEVVNTLRQAGKVAHSFSHVSEIGNFLLKEMHSGDLVVIMSNGDFGGLLATLVADLEKREKER